jgi:hypothetical protein
MFRTEDYGMLVYHAVDDIKEQPGMPREAIAAAELDLVKKADAIFVTSHNLLELHRPNNPRTWYFPNVADFDHFHRACDAATEATIGSNRRDFRLQG